ncbi:multiheme c-type cytochrome [Niabella beijingensis]|uniref:multiheme c-type cytochrome n=1 Tax=Niabella beijingensis TaxID=2872700 RepID=UPI001CC1B16B|nr:multiheme c-type cytochrome [Niabella beijingensis]MBZ4191960.1 hypothetical protein [Niabella beijingensis]
MKILTVLLLIICTAVCLLKCTDRRTASGDPRGSRYAGAASCVQCHKNISDDYVHTSHFNTSAKVDAERFRKLIAALSDTVHFPNDQLVVLETAHSKLVQSYLLNGRQERSEPLDVAFGSGEKAWTFAYWKDDQLFELPLTYLSAIKRWTNSPGFQKDRPNYTRPIVRRCFECHSSYAYSENSLAQGQYAVEQIKANTVLYGLDCERCHGPAAEHVTFHQDNPQEKKARNMVSIKALSRQQQLDLCATCHSGDPVSLRSIFAFTPGDSLTNYYMYYPGSGKDPDAHGMQMQSLMLSNCYQQSSMTCMSCHDPHINERNKKEVFVQRCMSCHQQSTHAITMQQGNNYCISCHMPLQASKSLDFNNSTEQSDLKYYLRTHRIAVYPETGK